MTATKFLTLGDAVLDEHFPAVDLALRRGRHIDRDDVDWFGFLSDAADVLEPFYRRFGADLVYRSDGFYYLLPTSDGLTKRQLSVAEMLVGQALTLLYLDPASVEQGGRVTRDQVVGHLATVMGTEALVRALNPKRRRYDERVAQQTVRARVADALRRLATLGFVDAIGAEELKLRPALLRFAEPVRAAADSNEALTRLVASGELLLNPLDSVPDGTDADEADDAESSPDAVPEDEAPDIDPDLLGDLGFEEPARPPATGDEAPFDDAPLDAAPADDAPFDDAPFDDAPPAPAPPRVETPE